MDTEGLFAPETAAEARQRYDSLGSTARTVVRQAAEAMAFDTEEYDSRVTGEVVETAREAVFASLLTVHVGDRSEYEAWCAEHECDVIEVGSGHVERVVWHAAPFAQTVVAATFEDERSAAVTTLRRQAFDRVYREVV